MLSAKPALKKYNNDKHTFTQVQNIVWRYAWKLCIAQTTYRLVRNLLADNYLESTVDCADFYN